MAKSKEQDTSNPQLKAILKKYGKVISTGSELLERKKQLKCLSFSPSMDQGLNGGLLEGSWTVLSGPPKQGKTTHCLQLCANAQKEGRKVIYLDGENRIKTYNLEGVADLDRDAMYVVHSDEDNETPMAAEDYLNITELLYKQPDYKGCLIVIDSTSSLLPRSELDAEVSGTIRANFPKLMAHWIKKNSQSIVNQKVIIILITHFITNTSGYGKQKQADGGLYMQYQADTILELNKGTDWMEGDKKVGLECSWKIITSSMGSTTQEVTTYLRYGVGIDKVQEIIKMAADYGLIDQAGAWYTCSFMSDQEGYNEKDYKFQGVAKLYAFLKENSNVYDILETKLRKLLS